MPETDGEQDADVVPVAIVAPAQSSEPGVVPAIAPVVKLDAAVWTSTPAKMISFATVVLQALDV